MKHRILVAMAALCAAGASAATAPTGRYKTAVDEMNRLVAEYPGFASVFSLGPNDEGTEIYALRISTTPSKMDRSKVGNIVVAAHHGNEPKSVDLALHFAEELLSRYDSSLLFSSPLADREWTIIPVLNVTGYNRNQRWEYGKDSNRDYPGPCHGGTGGKLASIRQLMNYLSRRPFAASTTIHGYIGTLTYPWGVSTTDTHTHDHNAYHAMTAKAARHNGYRHGTSSDLIYPATGAYEDYVYWKYGTWSLLVELESGSADDIERTSAAMHTWFDEVDSSPSVKNQMTGSCTRSHLPDLHIE